MDITRDIRTLEELEQETSKVIHEVRANRRPMVIMSGGEPGVVIIPADVLAGKMTALKAACELAEA